MLEVLERNVMRTATVNVPRGTKKCSYRGTVEARLEIDPNYIFYGSMQTRCRKCDGYKPKCPGYLV